MSEATKCAANKVITVWVDQGMNEWGEKSYGTPFTVNCTFDRGGKAKYADFKGIDFYPTAVAYFEDIGITFSEGDYIALGNHVGTPEPSDVDGAMPIKSVSYQDCSILGENDDVELAV